MIRKRNVETPKRPNAMFNHTSMRWKKGELIGSGAFGKVYMGLNEQTGSIMAVKELIFAEGDAQDIQVIQSEIDLLSSLSHENIVTYLGTECTPRNVLYIFTEWVPGGSLQQLQKKFGTLSESVVVQYTAQILKGLAYLHANHVIHRDIKAANVLVDDRGTIKLTDFGASKRIAGGTTMLDENQSLRGTPYFMAPEVIMQTGHGRKADIWSVGCTVLQLLTGQPPWKELKFDTSAALLFHIAHAKKPPTIPESLSEHARSFLANCFQMDPTMRSSAADLLDHPFFNVECATGGTRALPPKVPRSTSPAADYSSSFSCDVGLVSSQDSTEDVPLASSPRQLNNPPAPAIDRSRQNIVYKSTELLRKKTSDGRHRRHSHNKIQLDPIHHSRDSNDTNGGARKNSYNEREEKPIVTDFAQKQREQELLGLEKKRLEKMRKEQQWKAELAAYKSGELG